MSNFFQEINGEPSGHRVCGQNNIIAGRNIDNSSVNNNKLTSMSTTFNNVTIKSEARTDESQPTSNLFSFHEPCASLVSNYSVMENSNTSLREVNYNIGNTEMPHRRGDVSPTSTDVILSQGSDLRYFFKNNVDHREMDREFLNEEFKLTPPSECTTPVDTNSINSKYVKVPPNNNANVPLDELYQEIKLIEQELRNDQSKSIAEITGYKYIPGAPKTYNQKNPAFDELSLIEIKEYELYQQDKNSVIEKYSKIDWTVSKNPVETAKPRLLNKLSRRARALNKILEVKFIEQEHIVWMQKNHPEIIPLLNAVSVIERIENERKELGDKHTVRRLRALMCTTTEREICRIRKIKQSFDDFGIVIANRWDKKVS